MSTRLRFTIFVLFLLILSVFLRCGSGTQTIGYCGTGTETVGKLVYENGDPVQAGAIELYLADSEGIQPIQTMQTDGLGDYKLDSIPDGTYTIIGSTPDNKKIAFIGPFVCDSSDTNQIDLGLDTVHSPGFIQGCVEYPSISQNQSDVHVYIPGTSYSAMTDNGMFLMSGVPKGSFVLKFYLDGYATIKLSDITVLPGQATDLGSCIELEIDTSGPPPAPSGLRISQDTDQELMGEISLNWNSASVKDLRGYYVYRVVDDTLEHINNLTADTFFIDSLFLGTNDTIPGTVAYVVKSVDNKYTVSTHNSELAMIYVYPPCYYRNIFTFETPETTLGRDSISNADTAVLRISYINRRRTPVKITWSRDSLGFMKISHPVNGSRGLDSIFRGSDSVLIKWSTPGNKRIFIETIDDKGDTWVDTFSVEVYDSTSLRSVNKWVASTPIKEARYYAASTVVDDTLIYVMGGKDENFIDKNVIRPLSSVEIFNTREKSWISGVSIPEKRYMSVCAYVNGIIYLIGGTDYHSYFSSILKFDIKANKWDTCAVLPFCLSAMSVSVCDSKIFISGGIITDSLGWREYRISDLILKFDPQVNRLDTVGYMQVPRALHQSVCIDNLIYIMGGMNEEFEGTSSVEIFDTELNSVYSGISMKVPRLSFAAGAINGKIYIAGGFDEPNKPTRQVYNNMEYFDLNLNEWFLSKTLPSEVYGMSSVIADGGFYLIGGTQDLAGSRSINAVSDVNVFYPFEMSGE